MTSFDQLVPAPTGRFEGITRGSLMALAAEQGLAPRIAIVTGDDVLGQAAQLQTAQGTAAQLQAAPVMSANAYFGALPIAEALRQGADIVITGRCVDSASLLGIAVLNGVVLVSHFNELLDEGATLLEAVRRGSVRRLRPVLMTAAITALGMVPLLFATGPGSEIQRPLAIVVVGGLVSSTVLTLALLPMLFARFGRATKPELR